MKKTSLIYAHRGASHEAPENTIAAFRLALVQDADGIEGDFRLTRDGEIVCFHDATTQRIASANLEVAESTLAELKNLDVGRWKDQSFAGEQIPTLNEVLAILPVDKQILIELKSGPEIVRPLQRMLTASNLETDQIIVMCFNEVVIAESKRLIPEVKTHWLTAYHQNKSQQSDESWIPTAQSIAQTIHRIGADGLGSQANRDVLNNKFIDDLRAAGVNEFQVWTVDDPADAFYYSCLGARSVTTNRPGLLRKELKQVSE